MNREYLIRRIAGAFILVSLALAHWVSPHWLWFTAFVGLNLFQSSFTRVCPLEWVLERAKIGREMQAPAPDRPLERH